MSIVAVTGQESGSRTDSTTAAVTQAFGSNVALGNRIVVAACKGLDSGAADAFVVSDCSKSAGSSTIGAITLDASISFDVGEGIVQIGIWSAEVTGAGSLTMQIAAPASIGSIGRAIGEYSGDWGTTFDDGSSTGSSAVDGAPASGTVTSAREALYIGAAFSVHGVQLDMTPDAAFTEIWESVAGNGGMSVIRRIVTASTTDEASWTSPTNLGWAVALAVYKESIIPQDVGGSLSFAGATTKEVQKVLIGSLSFIGALTKETQRELAGVLDFVGETQAAIVFLQDVEGTLTFAGTLVKETFVTLDGGLTFSGDVSKEIRKNLTGTLSFNGAIAKLIAKQVSGELSFTGNLITSFLFSQIVTGTLSFIGGVATLFVPGGAGAGLRRMWRSLWSRVWKDPGKKDEDT